MTNLTARQAEVLAFIRQHIAEHGSAPTRAEIAAAFGLRSANSAEQYLRTLAEKGHLEVTGQARGIRLAAQHRERRVEMLSIPVVGRVAAGLPILAVENLDDHRDLAANLFEPAPDFLLRVQGQSMRDAGILDGDLLAVKATREVRNGQIVVARLGDEVTVKRLRRQAGHIELLPENPDYPVIHVHPEEPFEIEGLAVGLIRNTLLM